MSRIWRVRMTASMSLCVVIADLGLMPKLTVLVKYGNNEIYDEKIETNDAQAQELVKMHLRLAFNLCSDEGGLFDTVLRV